MRNLFFSLFATTVLYSVNAHALPIENADAFVVGDGKAVYEKSSGLTWLDFGINTDMTLYWVKNQLDSEPYAGWRLPTEAEVLHLFKALLPEFSVPDTLPPKAYGPDAVPETISDQIQSEDFSPRWNDIYSIWGVNDARPNVGEGNGHQFFSYSTVGLFLGNNGFVYSVGLHEFIFGAETVPGSHYYGQISQYVISDVYRYYSDPAASTLLVRDTPITVPEPGLMALFLLGFGVIFSQRFSSGKSSQR